MGAHRERWRGQIQRTIRQQNAGPLIVARARGHEPGARCVGDAHVGKQRSACVKAEVSAHRVDRNFIFRRCLRPPDHDQIIDFRHRQIAFAAPTVSGPQRFSGAPFLKPRLGENKLSRRCFYPLGVRLWRSVATGYASDKKADADKRAGQKPVKPAMQEAAKEYVHGPNDV